MFKVTVTDSDVGKIAIYAEATFDTYLVEAKTVPGPPHHATLQEIALAIGEVLAGGTGIFQVGNVSVTGKPYAG